MKTNILKMLFATTCGLMMASGAIAQNFPPNGTEAEEIVIGGPSKDYLTLEFPRGADQECAPYKGQRRSIGGDIAKYGKAVLVIIFPKDCPHCIDAADAAVSRISLYSDKLTVWYANDRLSGEGYCDDITEMGNKYPFIKNADFKFLDVYMWNNAWNSSWHYPEQNTYWTRKESPSVYRIFDPKSKKVTAMDYNFGVIEPKVQEAIKNNFTPLGAESVNANLDSYEVFPNPAKDNLTLNLNLKNAANAKVSIKNMLGVEVLSQELGNSNTFNVSLNIASLNSDMYLIQVISEGKSIVKDKFVKH